MNALIQVASPFPYTLEKNELIKSFCAAFVLLLGGNEKYR
jgi:hypothetical protein